MSDQGAQQKRNLLLGLDVSTSVTGICVLDMDNLGQEGILVLDRIEFKSDKNFWQKTDRVKSRFIELKKEFFADWKVALEEPLLGFQKGMSSATTITTLMRFNGIVSYISRDVFGIDPIYVSAAHARKVCGIKMQRTSIAGMSGKEQVFKYMSENDLSHVVWPLKKNGSPVDWSKDATDAYVIAKATTVE
jgi:hypothetical protein